jgi:hypothetical protein
MSLVFSILQKDYIVFAADSRHTRGDGSGGLYRNDQGLKVLEIERGFGVFGFAGRDWGENVVGLAKSKGYLDAGKSLEEITRSFSEFASQEYNKQFGVCDPGFKPVVEFMLTGWVEDLEGEPIATTNTFRLPDQASYSPWQYPYRRFQAIGKSCHGALYSPHRFGNEDLPLEAALRLAAFTLTEICEQDTSVGGALQIYTLKPGASAEKLPPQKIAELTQLSKDAGTTLADFLDLKR